MPSTRELRRRIRSVKSTRQITKAMELVSASKMRRATSGTLASRPYAKQMWDVVADITGQSEEKITHPLLTPREVKNVLCIVIASDRGLAGAYNTAILKQAARFNQEQEALGHTVQFITIGKRVEAGLLRLGYSLLQSYPQYGTHPHIRDIAPLSNFSVSSFLQGQFDQVVVLYTEFYSMLRQEATSVQLLPLQPESLIQTAASGEREFIYEPSPQNVLDALLPRLVEVQLYQSVQESLASEHSARRMAMKSATDNASSMIDDLNLTYNSLRQSAITQELAEITSGASALQA